MSYGGNTSFGEAWGAKGGPNWPDYRAINDHLARLQMVLRQGRPTFDVALYPARHLRMPSAKVSDGRLVSKAGAYRPPSSPTRRRW
ncbi:hypothetical protein AB0M79_23190 [Polymorphospora sp. NPDC051019]|uniref:hypothetical protein n=1 Tax=Polymorphospora sp. NPDC051019 TaxID=3155725 RepID=UPI003436BB87